MQQGASTQELLDELREIVLPVIGACLLMRSDDPRLADPRLGVAAEVANAVTKHLRTRIEHTPSDRNDWFAGDVDCDGNRLVTVRVDELVEVVRHAPDCPSLGGSGDADCTCGAVRFLDRALTTPEPTDG